MQIEFANIDLRQLQRTGSFEANVILLRHIARADFVARFFENLTPFKGGISTENRLG
jgi:hypothetical protein